MSYEMGIVTYICYTGYLSLYLQLGVPEVLENPESWRWWADYNTINFKLIYS